MRSKKGVKKINQKVLTSNAIDIENSSGLHHLHLQGSLQFDTSHLQQCQYLLLK